MITAQDILTFCRHEYGTEVDERPGAANIIYLEGCSAADLSPNADRPDEWNDTSMIIMHHSDGTPFIARQAEATSEPGLSATMSKQAAKLGGVARIAIGFHKEKWVLGYHKGNKNHPALVQCAPILCHRDKNRDGKRTGDLVTTDVKGLNQHGTRPNLHPVRVGEWSYACLARRLWVSHMEFIRLCAADPRRMYMDPNAFKFSSTVGDYSAFWKWKNT